MEISESSQIHTFVETVEEKPITFYVIKMKNSLFVWVGDNGSFENLAVAMNTKFSAMPISTSIMGQFADDNSSSLATKLSKKTGKQVFASFNLPNVDSNALLAINKRLMKELTDHPEKF